MLATTFQASNLTAIQICHILVHSFIEYKRKQNQLNTSTVQDLRKEITANLEKDLKMLKNFAIHQHEKNNVFEEHLEILFRELQEMKIQQTEPKTQIGFKKS